MRSLVFALLAVALPAAAQTPAEAPPPWERTPPAQFIECEPAADTVVDARRALQEARDAVAVGPSLPEPPGAVRLGAPLFGDADLAQELSVRADSGTVALVRAVAVGGDGLVFEGQYAGGGSRFRVYVDPADTPDADALLRYRARARALRAAVGEAEAHVGSADAEAAGCTERAAWAWRERDAWKDEYVLVRATGAAAVRDGTSASAARLYSISEGSTLWVGAMTQDETHFLVRSRAHSESGWVAAYAVPDAEGVRERLRPKMARWDRERAAEQRALFADTPDLRFTELVATGEYSMSGFRFEAYNLRAGKTVKYLHLSVRPYDRVGEPLSSRHGGGIKSVRLTGPMEPSTSTVYTGAFDNLWFSDLVACVRVTAVRAEYMDGTERSWRRSVDSLFNEPQYWNRCPGSR